MTPLLKIVRVGSKRQEELLERIAQALERLSPPEPPDTELTVESVDEIQEPKVRDESEGIES